MLPEDKSLPRILLRTLKLFFSIFHYLVEPSRTAGCSQVFWKQNSNSALLFVTYTDNTKWNPVFSKYRKNGGFYWHFRLSSRIKICEGISVRIPNSTEFRVLHLPSQEHALRNLLQWPSNGNTDSPCILSTSFQWQRNTFAGSHQKMYIHLYKYLIFIEVSSLLSRTQFSQCSKCYRNWIMGQQLGLSPLSAEQMLLCFDQQFNQIIRFGGNTPKIW